MDSSIKKNSDDISSSSKFFTPKPIVEKMTSEVVSYFNDPEKLILEPSCGEGIFLDKCIRERLSFLKSKSRSNNKFILLTNSINAVRNIYGIDICAANVSVSQKIVLDAVKKYISRSNDEAFVIKSLKIIELLVSKNIVQCDTLSGHDTAGIIVEFSKWSWIAPLKLNIINYKLTDIIFSDQNCVIPVSGSPEILDLRELVKN